MRIPLSILAVISVTSVGVLGNFYQTMVPRNGTEILKPVEVEAPSIVEEFKVVIPKHLTEKQFNLLNLAYQIGESVGLKDPRMVQGVVLKESEAGNSDKYKVAGQEFGLRTNERYYGVGQVKLSTAKHVLGKYPALFSKYGFHTKTDEEIIANLIMNDVFNLEVVSRYLKIISDDYCSNPSCVLASYNLGPAGAKKVGDHGSLGYVQGVFKRMKNATK